MQRYLNFLITILRTILFPLTVMYYLIIKSRNLLYNWGIFKQSDFRTPIISVGNITTGGTGKTPFVMYLTEYFIGKDKKVGVISRGYKSKSNELIIAHDGKSVIANVEQTGDELGMIVNRFSVLKESFYAIAYFNRIEAIRKMETLFAPDIILLDDAFQNRKIKKTVDIVLVNKERKTFLDGILLPAGNLREPLSTLSRADIILNNYKFAENRESKESSFNYVNRGFYNIESQKLNINDKIKAITVSGIADNMSFIDAVKLSGIEVVKSFTYADHFDYEDSDIMNFESSLTEHLIFITTEKDFIKLKEFKFFIEKYPVYYLRIDINLNIRNIEEIFIKKHLL